MISIRSSFTSALAAAVLAGCSAPGAGSTTAPAASRTFQGATYSTSLGNASNFGCTYAGHASGHLTIGPLDIISGNVDGIQADTMSLSFVLTSSGAGASCNLVSYTATRTNNAIFGTYDNMRTNGGDGFTNWKFAGALVGNALVGSLTLDVSVADPGTGNVITFPTLVISGYQLTGQ